MPYNAAVSIPRFKGLANNLDTALITFEYLQQADNIFLNNSGWIELRPGSEEIADAECLHITKNKHIGYIIASNILYKIDPENNILIPIKTDIGNGPYSFTDAGHSTYLITSSDAWQILSNSVRPWGVEIPRTFSTSGTGAGRLIEGEYTVSIAYRNSYGAISGGAPPRTLTVPDQGAITFNYAAPPVDHSVVILCSFNDGAQLHVVGETNSASYTLNDLGDLGREFNYELAIPPPLSNPICYHNGRVYIAAYDANQDYSEIYASARNSLHHFYLESDAGIAQQGPINLLASTPNGLVVGTDFEIIYHADTGDRRVLANYGVPKGTCFDYDDLGLLHIVTQHGPRLVGGEPFFSDITEDRLITDWGSNTSVGFIRYKGTSLLTITPFDINFIKSSLP